MNNSHIPTATTSRLLRLTECMRALEQNEEQEECAGSPFRTWVLKPLRKTLNWIGLFLLTSVAVLIRPKILHTVCASATNPFSGDRGFLLGAISFYELLGGQFIHFAALETMNDVTIQTIAKTIASVLALLFLVGVASLVFWVGARAANAPLRFQQSTRIACYAMGVVPVLLVHYTRQLHNLPVRTSVRPAEHEVL